ncbi:AAA family ATPase [Streptomyces sp. NPDC000941]
MLVGRRAELLELDTFLAECASNKARTVILEAPVGCGKSELLEIVATNAAEKGAVVLRATAMRSESALPLGVMRQLMDSPSLPAEAGRRLRALLDEDEATVDLNAADRTAPARAARMQKVCAALHEVVRTRLVLIGVDDLQHVDATSLQYLLYLSGRSRSTRLMMIFTETLHYQQGVPTYRTEFLRQPHVQRMRLHCLDRRATAELLTPALAEATLDYYFSVTGGNPLLLRALQEDHLLTPASTAQSEVADPVAGDAFAHAVLTCVDRSGPAAAEVADGLAILGEASTVEALSRLCEVPRAEAVRGVRALRAAGLVDDLSFRHPAARAKVLDGMGPAHRRDLHHRAASLLHGDGAQASVIAPHLRAARSVDQPWGVQVLQDAAEEVLADDEVRLAIAYLELAHRCCADAQHCAAIRIRTAVLMRRRNPSGAEKIAEELLHVLRLGRLAPRHCVPLVNLFLAHGRIEEANEVLEALRKRPAGALPLATVQVGAQLTYMAELCLPWTDSHPYGHGQDHETEAAQSPYTIDGQVRPNGLPWRIHIASDGDDPIVAAEEMLRRSVLTDSTIEPIMTTMLLLSERGVERARHWCELFMKEANHRDASGWYALFAGLRAEIAMRQGNLEDAETFTQAGLSRLPERTGSVLAGGLIATRVLAQTFMGKYEAAARTLNQPVSKSLFRSGYGLLYLRARGRYNLATNRPQAALDDILAMGQMARNWRADHPTWVPWRGDMAEALLQLGKRDKAERLVTDQLSRTRETDTRIRGISLRLLGTVAQPNTRLSLLNRAVGQLQIAGDRLELARALYDLSKAHRQRGDGAQAAAASRRAWQLAQECGAEPLCARLRLESDKQVWDSRPDKPAVRTDEANLSDSEKRVAVLAACGYSNRDISTRLYITVSTVEQHLTQVYRKLKIGGRQQLPVDLQFEVGEIV